MRISDIKDAVTGDVVTATRAGGTLTGPLTVIEGPGRFIKAGEGYLCGVRVREAGGSLREGVGVVSIERHIPLASLHLLTAPEGYFWCPTNVRREQQEADVLVEVIEDRSGESCRATWGLFRKGKL